MQKVTARRLVPTPPLSVAPMMDCTDRHFRYFFRTIARRPLLYTEMITSAAIVHGDRDFLLGFDPAEHPVALQLAGDDPAELGRAVEIAEPYGYDEINLNVGCPSDKVQEANIGACLMAKPDLVARLVDAIRSRTKKPVTVKHRIGIDDLDRYEDMVNFVRVVSAAGPDRFTVHARIAILAGLSPRENRTIPPLRYDDVYALKEQFPDTQIEINGGFATLQQIESALERVDGVMVGRAAYDSPYLWSEADGAIFGDFHEVPSRREVVARMIPYVERWEAAGLVPHRVLRHMLGLFAGMPGSRKWKQLLSPPEVQRHSGVATLARALELLRPNVLDVRGTGVQRMGDAQGRT